jgi:signal transduction histidine kinase
MQQTVAKSGKGGVLDSIGDAAGERLGLGFPLGPDDRLDGALPAGSGFVPAGTAPDRAATLKRAAGLLDGAGAPDARQLSELADRIARIGHWCVDFELQCAHWSEVMRDIHAVPPGYEPGLGSVFEFLEEGPHRDRLRSAVRAAIEHGQPYDLDLQVRNGDAQRIWVRTVGHAERVDGRCLRLYGTCQDIDARVQQEQARLAQAEADAAGRARSACMARMSQELRMPLNAVLAFSELLQDDPAVTAAPSALLLAQQIHLAGRQVLALIDGMLDLTRVEAGGLGLAPECLDLHELAQEGAALVRSLAQRQGVSVRVGKPVVSLSAHIDRRRARQVIANLLTNAIKYNRPGGSVDLTLHAEESQVHLIVRDSGVGLAPSQLAALYQPFNRQGAEHQGIDGNGLGLTITRQLVAAMGGEIDVQSQPGQGTVFTVSWPRIATDGPAGNPQGDEIPSGNVPGPDRE